MTSSPFAADFHLSALMSSFGRLTGEDLGKVRVRGDEVAGSLCRATGALALTIGNQVLLHPSLNPRGGSDLCREVLAHELVHVLQNRRALEQGRTVNALLSSPGDAAEVEADSLGKRLASGRSVRVRGLPSAWVQRVTMDNLKGLLGSAVYNEVAVSIRGKSDAGEKQNALDFSYALADVYADLNTYLNAANAPRGDLSTIAVFFVERKLSKNANLLNKNVETVKGWVDEIKQAGSNVGMAKGDVGLLFLAAAKRAWQASQLRKILTDSANLIGIGDASYSKIARWMYNFAFYHRGEIALGDMKFTGDKTVRVRTGPNTVFDVKIFQNRIKHIMDGHTFTRYVLDDESVGNLDRAFNGVQSFFPVDYTDLRIAQDIDAALLNAAEVRTRLQNGFTQFFDVPAPYHLRMKLAWSVNGVPRVATAFPASTIAQMNSNRIPEKILEAIYSLMAQGLGNATLRQVRNNTI